MKKLLYIIALSLVVTCTFAQKNFKTITFTRFLTTTGNPNIMDQGVFAKKDSYKDLKVEQTDKTGTININTAEEIITVKCPGEEDKIFKIGTVYQDKKDEYKTQTLLITCKDKMGVNYSLIIIHSHQFFFCWLFCVF